MSAATADDESGRGLGLSIGFGVGALLLFALAVWGVRVLMNQPTAPKRQVARIAILPDTPPPPPPKEEKKPEPKPEDKPAPQFDAPKLETPPEPQQLKMEGEAGDAPSPFAGGEVRSDYVGGEIGSGGGGDAYAAYTRRISQLIQDELSRRKLRGEGGKLLVWLSPDGSVQRFRLARDTGSDSDRQLQAAFAEIHRVAEPPPRDLPMPIGLEISVQ